MATRGPNTARLVHRVTLQEPTRTTDAVGGETTVWSDVACLWANIMPDRDNERTQGDRRQAHRSHRVEIHYRSGVTSAMRLLYGDRVLNIAQVISPDERNRRLELLCVEDVA